jgi:hypothetical protein
MFYFGRRLALVAVASTFATGLIGTGMLTSVPSTAIVLLLTGWIVVPEVRFAPTAASLRLKAEATRLGIGVATGFSRKEAAVAEDELLTVDDARTT